MAKVPDKWAHYEEQAASDQPVLDRRRSRGGIHELELAIDVMDAVFNDRKEVWPVNVPGRGAMPDFQDDLVVEVPGYVDRHGVQPIANVRPTANASSSLYPKVTIPGDRSPASTDSASVTTAPSTHPPLTLPTTSPSLDTAIAALQEKSGDTLQLARLKRSKLVLRDQIQWIEDRLTPDIIA